MPEGRPQINYTIDPNKIPSTWPTLDKPQMSYTDVPKVEVVYVNVNSESDFQALFTGTNDDIHRAVLQVAKHVERGLYSIVSLNASAYSCVVVMRAHKSRDDLMFKNGFPWDLEEVGDATDAQA